MINSTARIGDSNKALELLTIKNKEKGKNIVFTIKNLK